MKIKANITPLGNGYNVLIVQNKLPIVEFKVSGKKQLKSHLKRLKRIGIVVDLWYKDGKKIIL